MSLGTTDRAPTTAPWPMVTPDMINASKPTQTSLPTSTFPRLNGWPWIPENLASRVLNGYVITQSGR